MDQIRNTDEVKNFVAKKLRELEAYDENVDNVEHCKALMDREVMTKEEFLVTIWAVLNADI